MIVYMGGLVAVLVGTIGLVATDHLNAAEVLGSVGTMGWMLLMLAYIAIWDSRSRWPSATTWQRLVNVLSFQRRTDQ